MSVSLAFTLPTTKRPITKFPITTQSLTNRTLLTHRAPEILPRVVAALRDPVPDVRGGAAFTLGQMAEYLQLSYDFPTMHRDVLPPLFAVLPTEPDKRVQER